jgi:hypothetical protein
VGAVADAALPAAPDDSHSNADWDRSTDAFRGRELPGGFRVALSVPDLTIECRDPSGEATARFPLEHETLASARAWLGRELTARLDRLIAPVLRDYDMPADPVGEGAPFPAIDREALEELARWYADADAVLGSRAAGDPRATPVAIWPHHFDLGGILYLGEDGPPEKRPQIGFGFTPGDDGIDEPYFYLTPWPVAEGWARPALAAGAWIEKPFSGAVLRASDLPADAAAAEAAVRDYLASGLAASEAIVTR